MKKFFFLIVFISCAKFLYAQASNASQEETITICWDSSASMENRNIEEDFNFLDDFFKTNSTVTVQLLLFDIDIKEKNFQVINGDWEKLREELLEINYEGATIFSTLEDNIKHSKVFVFTDGQKLLDNDMFIVPEKSQIINSSPNFNQRFLERTALIYRASFINSQSREKSKSDYVRQTSENQEVTGTVYMDNKPFENARITLKGTMDSFFTDSNGSFSLTANIGDTLLISRVEGLLGKMVPVVDISPMKVFLESEVFFLDEATVVDSKLEKELVSNGYFSYDKDQLGYTITTIDSDDISSIETSVGDAVRSKVSGVDVATKNSTGVEGGLAQTVIRGHNSIHMNPHALVVVDGIPINRSSVDSQTYVREIVNFNYVDPGNIAEINVLKGLAATNLWGTQGANGVILITTKTAAGKKGGDGKIEDRARLKNNVYEDESSDAKSPFLKNLESSKTTEQAYDTYSSLKPMNQDNIVFYLDAFLYFINKNNELAGQIVSSLWENNPDKNEILNLLVTCFILSEKYSNAMLVNDELLERVPDDLNYRLNKAMILKETGKTKKALDEFVALANDSRASRKISKTLNREIKNLVFKNGNQINTDGIATQYGNNVKYKVRLVFEWNLPGAEFEIQFVNPQKRYFDWKHTNLDNKDRLRDEIENNYRIEEFEFSGDNISGEWIINAEASQNYKHTERPPLVLKTTVYQNFGSYGQSKKIYLTYFNEKGKKKNIANLNVD